MASTGRGDAPSPVYPSRRAALKAVVAAPLALLARGGEATEYASASDALAAMDRLSSEVVGRLLSLSKAVRASRALAQSLLSDLERHARDRSRIRGRLGLPEGRPPAAPPEDPGLEGLRASQQALVFAHAEGLGALPDARSVATLARHLVDLSRHLTVVDLWIEQESLGG